MELQVRKDFVCVNSLGKWSPVPLKMLIEFLLGINPDVTSGGQLRLLLFVGRERIIPVERSQEDKLGGG